MFNLELSIRLLYKWKIIINGFVISNIIILFSDGYKTLGINSIILLTKRPYQCDEKEKQAHLAAVMNEIKKKLANSLRKNISER